MAKSHNHFLSLHKVFQKPLGMELSVVMELVTAVGFPLASVLSQKYLLACWVQYRASDEFGCDVTLNR